MQMEQSIWEEAENVDELRIENEENHFENSWKCLRQLQQQRQVDIFCWRPTKVTFRLRYIFLKNI